MSTASQIFIQPSEVLWFAFKHPVIRRVDRPCLPALDFVLEVVGVEVGVRRLNVKFSCTMLSFFIAFG